VTDRPPFHVGFPVDDLAAARAFYREVVGCAEGRSSDTWVDFDLFGHQIVAHLAPVAPKHHNSVDGHEVPVPHFGVVLPWDRFDDFAERLRSHGVEFVIEPTVRFAGQPGEQATMFFLDPAGNALEFKSFRDLADLFAR
jgi:hypothetical protein